MDRILVQEPTHVGIRAFLYTLPHALRLAGSIKSIDPDIVIILGGNGVTADAEELSLDPHLDYVVKGEGVYAVSDLIEKLLPGAEYFRRDI